MRSKQRAEMWSSSMERYETEISGSLYAKCEKESTGSCPVTMYTIEGDPIIHELIYDGALFQSSYDATRDKYGSREEITSNTCKGLELTKVERGESVYVLTDCEKENVFYIPSM